ncbi:MAG: hypothetical protein ABI855_19930 [Bacteroidota bacterium]
MMKKILLSALGAMLVCMTHAQNNNGGCCAKATVVPTDNYRNLPDDPGYSTADLCIDNLFFTCRDKGNLVTVKVTNKGDDDAGECKVIIMLPHETKPISFEQHDVSIAVSQCGASLTFCIKSLKVNESKTVTALISFPIDKPEIKCERSAGACVTGSVADHDLSNNYKYVNEIHCCEDANGKPCGVLIEKSGIDGMIATVSCEPGLSFIDPCSILNCQGKPGIPELPRDFCVDPGPIEGFNMEWEVVNSSGDKIDSKPALIPGPDCKIFRIDKELNRFLDKYKPEQISIRFTAKTTNPYIVKFKLKK